MCYTMQVSRPRDQRYHEILEQAARLIFQRGYEATSMQDIAESCGLTKAGLYHHVKTKEALLHAIMQYGMDLFEEMVLAKVADIVDPVARLRECMARNIALVTQEPSKEVTIILHEHQTLTGGAKQEIDGRKKRYVRFLEASFREAIERGQIRPVEPTLAAFSFLGVVLWIYKWFRSDGKLSPQQISDGMVDMFFEGLMLRT